MKKGHQQLGQATIEFTFAVVIMVLIVYGMIMIFRWIGLTYAERRYKQEQSLLVSPTATEEQQVGSADGKRGMGQAVDTGYRARHLDAVYRGSLYEK